MRSKLNSIIEELKRLRSDGFEHIYVSESSLQNLKVTARNLGNDEASKDVETAVALIPERIRSSTPEEFDRVLENEPPTAGSSAQKKRNAIGKPPEVKLPAGEKQTQWDALREVVLSCPTCSDNVRKGYKIVFGVGNLDADIFFCGEAPGAEEEEKGEPFVGKAGKLLDKMIEAMGLTREQVYISNIMNWRPRLPTRVGNRPPTKDEIEFCLPYLRAQVEVVRPKLIVALGATAARGLLGSGSFRSLREIKSEWHEFENTPVLATYHPSYLLRNDSKRDKRSAWEDLLKVMERCELPVSDRQRRFFL